MTELYTLLKQSAGQACDTQRGNGSLPAGQNGPYNDSETPVRNTSHWLLTFSKLYDQTQDVQFRDAAQEAISYLLSDEARPGGATFHHRSVENKDSCNGVMGQAWTIEALTVAAETLERDDLLEVAEDVFLSHPFNETIGLWKQVEIDGTVLGFDATFNHQLWFAAAGGLLARHETVSKEVEQQVLTFLDQLEETVSIAPPGLIYHRSLPKFGVRTAVDLAKEDTKLFVLSTLEWTNLTGNRALDAVFNSRVAPVRRAPLSGEEHIHKSAGYHSFNLYALALLYESYPDHSFWSTDTFEAILSYAESRAYVQRLQDNKFGYAYNPPGFEIPFALETFYGDQSREQQKIWLKRQLERTYDPATNRLSRNNPDPETLTARLYEATRLPNLEVELDITEPSSEPSR
ncbi:agl cluster protein AglQ [Natronococcus sp. A-GB1]|uniref:agl cluster protein AglQ n=1 Tax=Natronococcus sp. A-GB1 TaxID=3037648 RepID=UPI00241F7341|nr:agl cluster protein AglQ [Natronococcus sp. A-GB1]MDG5761554.1 agl cluster protein AglQ [Natronococcus sp. A-GB1]